MLNLVLNRQAKEVTRLQEVLTGLVTTISDFKKNPSAEYERSGKQPFAVLKNNKPYFYVLSPEAYDEIAEKLWEADIAPLLHKRRAERHLAVPVDLNDFV